MPATVGQRLGDVSALTATATSANQVNLAWTDGATSDGSTSVSIPASADAYTLPAEPTALTATALSTSEIALAWTNNSTADTSIKILRSDDGVTFAAIAVINSADAAYADTGLIEGTHYMYQVQACDTALVSLLATADTYTMPTAASGLSITMSGGDADLSWTNNSASSPAFYIEQSTDGTNFSIIDNVAAGVTSYTDANPDDGETWYRVDAVNGDDTGYSTSASISVTNAILSPFELSARAVSSSEIDLEWGNYSAVADGITILRSTAGGSYAAIATALDPTTGEYADTGLTAGTAYAYEIEATQGATPSAASTSAGDTTVPPTPSGLTATPLVSTTQFNYAEVDLSWTATAGATGYDIQRKATGGSWQTIDQIADRATTTYDDYGTWAGTTHTSGIWDGITYSYQIDAYNDAGTSAFGPSSSATATTNFPYAPTNLKAAETSASTAQLVWVNNAYNEDDFLIERSDSTDGINFSPFSEVASVSPGVDTFTDDSLTAGDFYHYLRRCAGVHSMPRFTKKGKIE